jgi:hypothetical protein
MGLRLQIRAHEMIPALFINTCYNQCFSNQTCPAQQHRQSWQTTVEFNSADPTQIGKTITTNTFFEQFRPASGKIPPLTAWKQLDTGGGQLNATWKITESEQNGEMYEIKAGARKAIKMISGARFQWATINTETGEFFGAGG